MMVDVSNANPGVANGFDIVEAMDRNTGKYIWVWGRRGVSHFRAPGAAAYELKRLIVNCDLADSAEVEKLINLVAASHPGAEAEIKNDVIDELKIHVYRQQRVDGAIHNGVSVGDDRVLDRLENENLIEPDPVLDWYIDVSCAGLGLPNHPELVRSWLLDHSAELRTVLTQEADRLTAGIDFDTWPKPRQYTIPGLPIEVTVSCSAMLRVAARQMGQHFREFSDRWEEILSSLESCLVGA